MANNKQKYLPAAVIALVIVVIAGIQYFKNQKPNGPANNQAQEQNNDSPTKQNPKGNASGGSPNSGNELVGTLKISNNLKRGNLMLMTADRPIYLFTSRDYSSLLDKEVVVEIDGTMDNFSLVDIRAK